MFKLFVFIASVGLASCANFDIREHMANQLQHQIDVTNFQNERIREHQELTHQQKQMQIQQLNDQRRVQEQMIRDHEQRRLNRHRENQQQYNVQVIVPNNHATERVQVQPAIVNIPSSTRHFNVHDDSNYNFNYAVSDMMTGDIKTHQEVRRGDEVQGKYTTMDSDGYQRTVSYRANDRDGFDAEVRREPAYPILLLPAFNQPQINNYNGFSNYQGHHNQHNFDNNNQEQWNYSQQINQIPQPISVASTSVSKIDDGQQNQYTTKTATI